MLLDYQSSDFSYSLDRIKMQEIETSRFTVLIGANGTGKSRLLSDIATRSIELFENRSAKYTKMRKNKPAQFISNPIHVESLLAVSNLITDSFPFSKSVDGRYRYLGHKRGVNMFTTGSPNHFMIASYLDISFDNKMTGRFRNALTEIGIKNVQFTFRGKLNISSIKRMRDRLDNREDSSKHRRVLGVHGFESLDSFGRSEAFIEEITNWISNALLHKSDENTNRLISHDQLDRFMHIARYFEIKPSKIFEFLKQCSAGQFRLVVQKNNHSCDFEDLSVGEQLILSTTARIAANVSHASIILIDEPEVGLHPNWQQRLIPILKRVIPSELGCHFIIATHSPFIVSEADDILIPGTTWGNFIQYPDDISTRSIDDILYRVFNARISGNSAAARDVQMLLNEVSGTERFEPERIRGAFHRLSRMADEETLELNMLLEQVQERLS